MLSTRAKSSSLCQTEVERAKELERSCVEKSARVLADEAIADSSTAERKVRQQVEQRLKERKQLKVQNWEEGRD